MMIRKCTCGHEYGLWRLHCPACGTTNDQWTDANARATVPVARAPRRPRNECIVCTNGSANETCPHCDERIHKVCLRLHVEDCKRFQEERECELRKTIVRDVTRRAEENALNNPSATATAIVNRLKGR